MDQLEKYLLYKHESPSLIPRTHIKNWVWNSTPVIQVLKRWRQEGP